MLEAAPDHAHAQDPDRTPACEVARGSLQVAPSRAPSRRRSPGVARGRHRRQMGEVITRQEPKRTKKIDDRNCRIN